jgi:L-iditol 2-dehydrogenase
MKAVVLTGVGRVEVRDVPKPEIKAPDDVLLKTAVAGLCGSDLHYFVADRVGGETVAYPAIVGHECSAVVEAVGSSAAGLKPGDRVAVEPAVSCGTCDQCRGGRPHTCRNLGFLGHPGEKDGCLAENFVMPARNCIPLPAGLTMTQAILAEPLSIALHAFRFWAGSANRTMAVLGSGPIGLCVLLEARQNGVREIYATDKVDERAEAALKAGAAWAGNPDRQDIVRDILARRPLGLDAVFECCGDQAALDQAVELLKPGGTLIFVGIPLIERVSFPSGRIRRKEIRIQNVRRQNRCLEHALDLVGAGKIDLNFLATHTFEAEDAQKAFETAAFHLDGALKVSIAFEEPDF